MDLIRKIVQLQVPPKSPADSDVQVTSADLDVQVTSKQVEKKGIAQEKQKEEKQKKQKQKKEKKSSGSNEPIFKSVLSEVDTSEKTNEKAFLIDDENFPPLPHSQKPDLTSKVEKTMDISQENEDGLLSESSSCDKYEESENEVRIQVERRIWLCPMKLPSGLVVEHQIPVLFEPVSGFFYKNTYKDATESPEIYFNSRTDDFVGKLVLY